MVTQRLPVMKTSVRKPGFLWSQSLFWVIQSSVKQNHVLISWLSASVQLHSHKASPSISLHPSHSGNAYQSFKRQKPLGDATEATPIFYTVYALNTGLKAFRVWTATCILHLDGSMWRRWKTGYIAALNKLTQILCFVDLDSAGPALLVFSFVTWCQVNCCYSLHEPPLTAGSLWRSRDWCEPIMQGQERCVLDAALRKGWLEHLTQQLSGILLKVNSKIFKGWLEGKGLQHRSSRITWELWLKVFKLIHLHIPTPCVSTRGRNTTKLLHFYAGFMKHQIC